MGADANGQRLVYESDKSGRHEIYVLPPFRREQRPVAGIDRGRFAGCSGLEAANLSFLQRPEVIFSPSSRRAPSRSRSSMT
jgi:hypothetical protein